MSIESDVLKLVRPPAAQDKKVSSIVDELSEKVVDVGREIGAHIEPMLVGSVAKGTHLKDPDIDLFMLFPSSTPVDELKEKGLEIGRRVIDGKEHYAQHPYVRGIYKGFQIDLVPAFRVRDTWSKLSAVDRTPFHTDFIKKNLKKGLADEIRLLKRFMKGTACYGAEAKVQGFSGYLCELLVMRYGGFAKTLEAASAWKAGEHLDLPGHEEFSGVFTEPLVFIDPVDPSRNVASAVSHETLVRFILASREYIGRPDMKFFFPTEVRPWTPDDISRVAGKRLGNLISITSPRLDLIDDVVYPQLRKSLVSMTALLERSEFEVEKTSIFIDDRTHLLVETVSLSLPKERKHRGPPVNSENVNEFLAKWKDGGLSEPYIDGGRWWVMTKREWQRADAMLEAKLGEIPLGKDIKKQGQFKVEAGEKLLRSQEHMAALTHHFDERMPWQR